MRTYDILNAGPDNRFTLANGIVVSNCGRGVQLQNLPQNHLPDLDSARDLVLMGDLDTFQVLYPNVQGTLSELIRTVLIPEEGHKFIVADFSAIEARVLSWIAGEQWRIEAFKNGEDIYCTSATKAFGVPVTKHNENAHLRQAGKILELACGYGGGAGAVSTFAALYGIEMSDEQKAENVEKWRAASPRIVGLWKALDRAAQKCVASKKSITTEIGHIRFDYEDGVMWMNIPSGRRIAYWGADRGQDKWGRPSLTYMGQNQTTKKWEKLETFGGKLCENLVQAAARDCLKVAMLNLNEAGFDIRGHVHDEVIITEPIDGRGVDDVIALMCKGADWTEGLPLNAAGYECTSYRKD